MCSLYEQSVNYIMCQWFHNLKGGTGRREKWFSGLGTNARMLHLWG